MFFLVIVLFAALMFIGWGVSHVLSSYSEHKFQNSDEARKELGSKLKITGVILFVVNIICIFTSTDFFWVIVWTVAWLISVALVFAGVMLQQEGEKKDPERRKNYCYLEGPDRYNEKLVVSNTGTLVGEVLDYTEMHETYLRNDPLKVHVGGAVVGGVFSGGVYTTGGKTQLTIGAGTGVYHLFYYDKKSVGISDSERYHSIKRIVLKGDAAEAAKKSPSISSVLIDADELYLKTEGSKEYCKMVKNWLSQESKQPIQQYQPVSIKELEVRAERKRLAEQKTAQTAKEVAQKAQRIKQKLLKYGPKVAGVAAAILIIILLVVNVVIPEIKYSQADKLVEAGQYYEAIQIYGTLGDSPKAAKRIDAANYSRAEAFMVTGDYKSAISLFEQLGDYEDATQKLNEARYAYAEDFIANKDFISGIALYEQLKDALGDYKDVADKLKEARYAYGQELMSQGRIREAIIQFQKVGNYKDAQTKTEELKVQILFPQWSADVVAFNTDFGDLTTIMKYAPTKADQLHVLFQINGKEQGGVLDVSYIVTYQNGETWNSRGNYPIKNGNYLRIPWEDGWDAKPGTMKITIVRSDTNENIGEFSFEIK